ncbi:hypothetical protein V5799_022046 [Amblyomma americanum]|uniref:TIR domain-containing protein n=1 Tax=Amblyomma americanum TaxID=6943 RepID=A0AAQ4FM40_AMBAM
MTEAVPDKLKDLINPAKTSRFLFCGYSSRKMVKRDVLMTGELQLSDSDETTLSALIRDSTEKMQNDVKILTLLNSKLKSIPESIFKMRALERLSIKRTVLGANESFSVSPVPLTTSHVRRLSLEGTAVHVLHDQDFCNFPDLRYLNLEMCSLRAVYGSPFMCLSYLQELRMPNNALTAITREMFKGLNSLNVLRLSKNKLNFYDAAPVFAPLTKLNALYLGQNMIDALFPEIFIELTVTTLELEANLISNWSTPIFSRMAHLEILNLDSNKIRVLGDVMYADVANVTRVSICHSPWDCTDCHIKNVERLLAHADGKTCAFCSGNKGPLADLHVTDAAPDVEECKPPDYYALVGVPTLLIFLAGTFGGYSVYTNRWYIRYFLLFLRVKVKGYRRIKSGDRYLWDAFVSYHHSDADWVREYIIPTLESTALQFRLCVGERDFIPGLPIVENVCRGIAQSRKSLFVLSRRFCASRWCMFELSLAKHRLFESDRENQMVFILREHIEESEMCPLLRYLSGTKTYVQVPPAGANESVQGYFWLQLRAALEF